MISDYVDVHPPAASKKIKARKKSTDLKISTDLKQNLDAKTESKCVIFWKKICPCLSKKEKRSRQIKRAIALFCLCMYCFDVGSDLKVGVDLRNRCHHITGKILQKIISILNVLFFGNIERALLPLASHDMLCIEELHRGVLMVFMLLLCYLRFHK